MRQTDAIVQLLPGTVPAQGYAFRRWASTDSVGISSRMGAVVAERAAWSRLTLLKAIIPARQFAVTSMACSATLLEHRS